MFAQRMTESTSRDEMDEMMMIDPVDGDDDEAEDVGKKSGPHSRERSWIRIVRGLQFQNHDGNENGDNTIAERFEPIRFHGGGSVSI